MNRSIAPLLLLMVALSTDVATAQSPAALPSIVTQRIDDDTILVARFDLSQTGVTTIGKFLRGIPDPFGSVGSQSIKLDQALQKLAALKASEVFVLASTTDLLTNETTIIVPNKGAKSGREEVAEVFKSLGIQNCAVMSDGVVVGTVPIDFKPVERPEFAIALSTIKGSQVQIAAGLGMDARRVLRDILPTLPREFGGGSIAPISDGCQWVAFGFTPLPKPDFQFVVQGNDVAATEALGRVIEATRKTFLEKVTHDGPLRNLRSVVEQITARRKGERITASLSDVTDANARKQIEEKLVDSISQLSQVLENKSRQMRTAGQLKQLMLAMHYYHDAHKAFPPAAVRSADGKKLLSWRVLLLPLLGEEALFKEFHLDEPWDSDHNSKLISRMPEVFESSNISRPQREKGMTTYLGLIADKTLFASVEGIPIKKITDGTSNTIAIVDANSDHAVIWTSPQDLEVDLKQPLKGLTGQYQGRFWAALCDGSVRTIPEKIDAETLRRLFQINDGEAVGEY